MYIYIYHSIYIKYIRTVLQGVKGIKDWSTIYWCKTRWTAEVLGVALPLVKPWCEGNVSYPAQKCVVYPRINMCSRVWVNYEDSQKPQVGWILGMKPSNVRIPNFDVDPRGEEMWKRLTSLINCLYIYIRKQTPIDGERQTVILQYFIQGTESIEGGVFNVSTTQYFIQHTW